jgi:hypothetical protein
MAEIGHGYGSEFQLLRFMGHHRLEFDQIISDEYGKDFKIEWLDYPYDRSKLSGDAEYIGINFLAKTKKYLILEQGLD